MSDTRNMLPTGSGMPIVTVATSGNKPIIDPVSQLPVGELVTQFTYEYNEEKDDKCDITITCDNQDLVDLIPFQPQQYLLVQWGLKYPNGEAVLSPVRKVMVRDTRLRLSPNGVIITIKCTDGLSILKSSSLKKNPEDNFVDWITGALTGNYKFRCFLPESKEVKPTPPPKWTIGPNFQGTIWGGVYYNVPQQTAEGLKEVTPDKLIKRRTFMQIGKTPYTALKDATKTLPNGPYHLDGRDDSITIHPTNFNQSPIATFTWKGETGEMISLDINTRKKAKGLDIAQKSQIDPKTKSRNTNVTQTDGNVPNLNYDGITGEAINIDQLADTETTKQNLEKNETILKQNASKYLNEVIQKYKDANGDPKLISEISLQTYKVPIKVKVKEEVDPRDYGTPGSDIMGDPKVGSRAVGWDKLKRDKTKIIVKKPDGSPYSYGENPEVIMDKEIELELSGIDLLGYAGDLDSSTVMAFNKVADSLQKQLEATLTTIGQPYIESSKIVTLKNVSKRYSGDWYTKVVTHKIDSGNGYTTSMEMIKKTSANSLTVQSNTQVNTTAFAKKLQKISKELSDPVARAKAEEVVSNQEKILQEYKDAGDVLVITDDTGNPVAVKADEDWVDLNKATETEEINRKDNVLKDKTQ